MSACRGSRKTLWELTLGDRWTLEDFSRQFIAKDWYMTAGWKIRQRVIWRDYAPNGMYYYFGVMLRKGMLLFQPQVWPGKTLCALLSSFGTWKFTPRPPRRRCEDSCLYRIMCWALVGLTRGSVIRWLMPWCRASPLSSHVLSNPEHCLRRVFFYCCRTGLQLLRRVTED